MNAILPARRKMTVEEYYRMAEVGILKRDDRVELIEGDVIAMAPIGTEHAASVGSFTKLLVLACGDLAEVRVQSPVRLSQMSEPEPDFAIVRPSMNFYRDAHPGAADVLLLIEIADTSLRFDRTVKLPLYARSGIGEVWIVDVQRNVMEAFRKPAGDAYLETTEYQPGQSVTLALAPEITVPLGLWPR